MRKGRRLTKRDGKIGGMHIPWKSQCQEEPAKVAYRNRVGKNEQNGLYDDVLMKSIALCPN